MKTCKTGCGGKMKVGGTIKKMSKGGSTNLVGMPKYGNNPNTQEGRMLKKGGAIKKYPDGGSTPKRPIPAKKPRSPKQPESGAGTTGGSRPFNRPKPSTNQRFSPKPLSMRTIPLTSMKVDTKTIAPAAIPAPVEKPTLKQKIGQKLVNAGSKMQQKKGGSVKRKYPDGGQTIADLNKADRRNIFSTPSGKAGIITSLVGGVAEGIAMGLKKRREKKAAKEAEKKKKETATPKAKFGASVPVKHNPPKGMRHDSEHKGYESVAKAKKGGTLKPVPADKVGLSKLPTAVRNKMGYMKKGGVKKR